MRTLYCLTMEKYVEFDKSKARRVSYFYDPNIGAFHYAGNHPMKPFRIRMTDALVSSYGLHSELTLLRPTPATSQHMTKYHTDDYIDFLYKVSLEPPTETWERSPNRNFNFGDDCPPFEGIYDFSALSAGGSIEGAAQLNAGDCQIAINWSGGLHHAKKTEASGFCYVNDIVLAILELLKSYQRVLYVDIDVHHGDGVEEAFYATDRVMTVSFHLYGNGFFPGTGNILDVGAKNGKYYAVNVPLKYGITDDTYASVFRPIMTRVMDCYRPGAIVLQLGADSLAGDKLGMFNLSLNGHSNCVEFMKSFNIPMLMLGGGGYTIRNVARTWAQETAVALGAKLSIDLPHNDFIKYYGPEYTLEVLSSNITNTNTREYLEQIVQTVSEHLRHLPFAPSVQNIAVPVDHFDEQEEEDSYFIDFWKFIDHDHKKVVKLHSEVESSEEESDDSQDLSCSEDSDDD